MANKNIFVTVRGLVDYGQSAPGPVDHVTFGASGSNVTVDFKSSSLDLRGAVIDFSGSTVTGLATGSSDFTSTSLDFGSSTINFTSTTNNFSGSTVNLTQANVAFSGSILNFSGSTVTGSLRLASSFDQIETNTPFGSYRVRDLTNGGSIGHTIHIPADFVRMENLWLAFIPNGQGITRSVSIAANHCDYDQDILTHTSSFTVVFNLTSSYSNGGLKRISISASLNRPPTPGSFVAMTITNNTTPTLSLLGTYLTYYREM